MRHFIPFFIFRIFKATDANNDFHAFMFKFSYFAVEICNQKVFIKCLFCYERIDMHAFQATQQLKCLPLFMSSSGIPETIVFAVELSRAQAYTI